MRHWDQSGKISHSTWVDASAYLSMADAIVFSWEDVGDDRIQGQAIAEAAQAAVITDGEKGCTVFHGGGSLQIPSRSVLHAVDPTGAGDIFAAAFFVFYERTRNPVAAAYFATELAGASVMQSGLSGVPSKEVSAAAWTTWEGYRHDS